MASEFALANGYAGLGHVLTATMIDNTMLLGLAPGQRQMAATLRSVAVLAGFVFGVLLRTMPTKRPRDWCAAPTTAHARLAIISCAGEGHFFHSLPCWAGDDGWK